MNDLSIINTTPDNIQQFGMCGYKNTKNEGYLKKLDWTCDRFKEGMRYKILLSEEKGAIGGIEYLPGENAWRPVEASGYMFIHCIYIMKKDAKGRGYGKKLVQACLDDAEASGMKGVAVVTRKGSWMAGKELFLSMDFETVDKTRPDFELLVFKFDQDIPSPAFTTGFEDRLQEFKTGLHIFTSHQCPYTTKATTEISEAAINEFKVTPNIIHLQTAEQARQAPFPFGTFGIVLNGKVVADHPVSQTRFRNIMKKEL